jgi:hypothetical protein
MGLTKLTFCGVILFKLNTILIMFLQVPSIDSTFFLRPWGLLIFFSLVLILRIPMYWGVKGDQFF